ncbi:serine/threonine-protein kinase STE20-like [Cyprinodon tularosa]|uniref:serine/threonine-protein kinase STE20-like n=1 Tax=Cyprinodon tularosa TaxID=77115 RepID=UPI0018E245D5|nr:serine/threonine-protein kinase STE20-like [Cyprinodon tularosa]
MRPQSSENNSDEEPKRRSECEDPSKRQRVSEAAEPSTSCQNQQRTMESVEKNIAEEEPVLSAKRKRKEKHTEKNPVTDSSSCSSESSEFITKQHSLKSSTDNSRTRVSEEVGLSTSCQSQKQRRESEELEIASDDLALPAKKKMKTKHLDENPITDSSSSALEYSTDSYSTTRQQISESGTVCQPKERSECENQSKTSIVSEIAEPSTSCQTQKRRESEELGIASEDLALPAKKKMKTKHPDENPITDSSSSALEYSTDSYSTTRQQISESGTVCQPKERSECENQSKTSRVSEIAEPSTSCQSQKRRRESEELGISSEDPALPAKKKMKTKHLDENPITDSSSSALEYSTDSYSTTRQQISESGTVCQPKERSECENQSKTSRVSEIAEPSTSCQTQKRRESEELGIASEDLALPAKKKMKTKHLDENPITDSSSSALEYSTDSYSTTRQQISESGTVCQPKERSECENQSKTSRVSEIAEPSTSCQSQKRRRESEELGIASEDPALPAKKKMKTKHLDEDPITDSSSSPLDYNTDSGNNTRGQQSSESSTDGGHEYENQRKRIAEPSKADLEKAKFQEKYVELNKLVDRGSISVFAGYRIEDNSPVAIKHIQNVVLKHRDENGRELPLEVAIMFKLMDETVEQSFVVSLFDWYDLGKELILVMERPMPCNDLAGYLKDLKHPLKNKEAKVILKQLVKAAIHLKNKNIFHRDIKLDNILIKTDSEPQIYLKDFGLSSFGEGRPHLDYCDEINQAPMDWFMHANYTSGPITVWQIGVVLFDLTHKKSFETKKLHLKQLQYNKRLSKKAKDFLNKCLELDPLNRPTLEELLVHPWLL